jgi:hypothetical protein
MTLKRVTGGSRHPSKLRNLKDENEVLGTFPLLPIQSNRLHAEGHIYCQPSSPTERDLQLMADYPEAVIATKSGGRPQAIGIDDGPSVMVRNYPQSSSPVRLQLNKPKPTYQLS